MGLVMKLCGVRLGGTIQLAHGYCMEAKDNQLTQGGTLESVVFFLTSQTHDWLGPLQFCEFSDFELVGRLWRY